MWRCWYSVEEESGDLCDLSIVLSRTEYVGVGSV